MLQVVWLWVNVFWAEMVMKLITNQEVYLKSAIHWFRSVGVYPNQRTQASLKQLGNEMNLLVRSLPLPHPTAPANSLLCPSTATMTPLPSLLTAGWLPFWGPGLWSLPTHLPISWVDGNWAKVAGGCFSNNNNKQTKNRPFLLWRQPLLKKKKKG